MLDVVGSARWLILSFDMNTNFYFRYAMDGPLLRDSDKVAIACVWQNAQIVHDVINDAGDTWRQPEPEVPSEPMPWGGWDPAQPWMWGVSHDVEQDVQPGGKIQTWGYGTGADLHDSPRARKGTKKWRLQNSQQLLALKKQKRKWIKRKAKLMSALRSIPSGTAWL